VGVTEAALPVGKLPCALLDELLAAAPELPPEVLLGPRVGEDACVIAVDDGVLVAASDPITLTGRGVGSHAVVINANDIAVTGVRPRYFLATILLPLGSTPSQVRELFADMRAGLEPLAIVLVGGHTEITAAVSQPVVAGTMLGLAPAGGFLSSGAVEPGDVVLQVGAAPVEGAAVLASASDPRAEQLAADMRRAAETALVDPGISVVESALLAAELGARALHDPTEGGLSAGLYELADASGLRLDVDADAVLWFAPGQAMCAAFGADPWGTLASGSLLAAFPVARADEALRVLRSRGLAAARIANACSGAGVYTDGAALVRYERDELSRVL
jgi:hydrogenase maturation factor